jgi:DNA polymerase IV
VGKFNNPSPNTSRDSERSDDRNCNILHVDMDAFFAAVEVRDNPTLMGKQVIVGHGASRGVVLSATYPARVLGVRAAMPMSQALRLAPHAVVVEPRMQAYRETSKQVMTIFESITPLVQPLSLDEAFLDVSGALKLMGSPSVIGDLVRSRVEAEQGITCSVGVAPTMFVAKLATNFAKPNGLHVVAHDKVLEFLHPLPLGALWGVGEKTASQLERLGLRTVADIANTPVKILSRVIGDAAAQHLTDLAWGRDLRSVTPHVAEKSIGAERTFDHDIDDPELLLAQLLDLSTTLASRLRSSDQVAKTITLKVRSSDFTTITRSKSLEIPTDVGHEIYFTASQLFHGLDLSRTRIRLLGVRATGLRQEAQRSIQLAFNDQIDRWREAEQVMDQVADKFGQSLVKPARLIRVEPEI